jgi:hypothetical protein
MVKVADLTRKGFINGDISTVMSPRTVITWAQNALIFGDVGFAFRLSFLNKCDEAERRAGRRILPARVRQGPARERRRQGLRVRTRMAADSPLDLPQCAGRHLACARARARGRAEPSPPMRPAQDGQAASRCRCRRARCPPIRWPRRAASPTASRCGCATTTMRSTCKARRSIRSRAGVRCGRDSAGRGAGRAGYAGIAANLDRTRSNAAALRSDHRARNARGSAAVDRARADGARAADRAKRPPMRRAGHGAGPRLDRGEGGRRSRRAGAGDRRPARLRHARDQAARGSRADRGDMLPDEPTKAAARTRAPTTGPCRRRGRRERSAERRRRDVEARGEQREADSDQTARAPADRRRDSRATAKGDEGEEGMLPVRPNRPWTTCRRSSTTRPYTTRFDEVIAATELCDAEELTGCALSRPAARPSAGRGDQARQPAPAPADGAAEPQLGFRPGGRDARRRAAGARRRQSRCIRSATRSSATPSSRTRSSPC